MNIKIFKISIIEEIEDLNIDFINIINFSSFKMELSFYRIV